MFPVDSELVLASQGTSRVLTPSSCKSPPVGNHAASVLWAPVSSTKSPLTRVFQLPPPPFFSFGNTSYGLGLGFAQPSSFDDRYRRVELPRIKGEGKSWLLISASVR